MPLLRRLVVLSRPIRHQSVVLLRGRRDRLVQRLDRRVQVAHHAKRAVRERLQHGRRQVPRQQERAEQERREEEGYEALVEQHIQGRRGGLRRHGAAQYASIFRCFSFTTEAAAPSW